MGSKEGRGGDWVACAAAEPPCPAGSTLAINPRRSPAAALPLHHVALHRGDRRLPSDAMEFPRQHADPLVDASCLKTTSLATRRSACQAARCSPYTTPALLGLGLGNFPSWDADRGCSQIDRNVGMRAWDVLDCAATRRCQARPALLWGAGVALDVSFSMCYEHATGSTVATLRVCGMQCAWRHS